MQEPYRSQVDAVNPLIKIIKEREELFFQLLNFVATHLSTSSYDLDNTSIFKKYISLFDNQQAAIRRREEQLLESLIDPFAEGEHSEDPVSKQMLRLSSRVCEILEGSLGRVQKSVFEDNGRSLKEFARFKSTLNKILKRQYFVVRDFVEHVVAYTSNKFGKQLGKLRKYLERVELGDQIWFRELYALQNSDIEHSPERPPEEKTVRKLQKKLEIDPHLSSTEERDKKGISLKKTMKPATKRRERLLNIKNKGKQAECQEEGAVPNKKQQTANKLYKLYALLDLNKKEFLEDYMFDRQQQDKHKNQLLVKLLQRNKTINSQINAFVRKSTNYLPIPIVFTPAKSSGDQRNESVSSKVSLRTSFVISKRKSSFHFDTSGNEKASDNENREKKDDLANTIRNLNPRRRSSHSNPRPQEKSKKLFVVKAPVIFEEEIPQAQITQTQWLQAPLTVKGRDKKTENIRLKRKNNVNPLQNAFLPQNFRYPF